LTHTEKTGYTQTAWENLLKAELDADRPIEYAGYDNSGGGHAWVCDGYQGTNYFHMNWGWGGYGNGYFYLTNLNPPGYTFTWGHNVLTQIQPNPSLYPINCSGQTDLDIYDFGSMEDGSGPVADYPNNANCTWLIAPDDSVEKITLSFVRFATETGDNVTVYDGSTTTAPVLGTFSGNTLPPNVVSTGAAMLVTFTSNGSGTANGFLAEYDCDLYKFCQSTTTLTDPTGDLSDGSGRFNYRNSSSCKWFIFPTNASSVTLTYETFNSEAGNDKLIVYDYGAGVPIDTVSGAYTTPPPPVTATSGKLMLVWTSNKEVRGEGWSGYYTTITGMEKHEAVDNLYVYPNPASDNLTVKFELDRPQTVRIDLLSLKGETVYSESHSRFTGTFNGKIDLSSLSGGVYMLRVISERGISNTKIIVR
jgi:hypothetical protein